MEDATLGGYRRKHDRPPAFEGSDGRAYSVEIFVDPAPLDDGRFGAALLFVRWSEAGDRPDGHLESGYLGMGADRAEAEAAVAALTLHEVKAHLERAVAGREAPPAE